MQPGIEPLWVAKGREVAPRSDEGVLDGVLRPVGIPKNQPSRGIEAVDRRASEFSKGVAVASPRTLHELSLHACPRRRPGCLAGSISMARPAPGSVPDWSQGTRRSARAVGRDSETDGDGGLARLRGMDVDEPSGEQSRLTIACGCLAVVVQLVLAAVVLSILPSDPDDPADSTALAVFKASIVGAWIVSAVLIAVAWTRRSRWTIVVAVGVFTVVWVGGTIFQSMIPYSVSIPYGP